MAEHEVVVRRLDAQKDCAQIGRIWREIAWVEGEDEAKHLEHFLRDAVGFVALVRGEVEACVTAHQGVTLHQKQELSMWAVTSVTVSRVARRMGLAGRLTALLLAEGASRGYSIAMLGMFEQGFYDRLGFGTGSYERFLTFDPASVQIRETRHEDPIHGAPERISAKDYEAVQRGRVANRRNHGFSWLCSSEALHAEMMWTKEGFGLGYFNEDHSMVTHHIWCKPEGEHGPYEGWWSSYRDDEDMLRLLSIVKGLGDQVHSIEMKEPPGLSLQDFILRPFKQRRITRKGSYESRHSSAAYWQLRILNMEAVFSHLSCKDTQTFLIDLTDPVGDKLGPAELKMDATLQGSWTGLDGRWLLRLGPESGIARVSADAMPEADHTISTDVGSLSRLWFGAASARSLALQGKLVASVEAEQALDELLSFPEPHPWWDF